MDVYEHFYYGSVCKMYIRMLLSLYHVCFNIIEKRQVSLLHAKLFKCNMTFNYIISTESSAVEN